jgi:hypothetical protein
MKSRPRHEHLFQPPEFDSSLNILFLAGFPLVLWVLQGDTTGMLTAFLLMGLLSLAVRLISAGHRAQNRYDAQLLARRPRLPLKLMGSIVIGAMVFVLAGHHFAELTIPAALGASAMLLCVLAFGLDPMKDKGVNDAALVQKLEAQAQRQLAEAALTQVTDRIALLGDAEVTRQTEATRSMIRRIVRALSDTPKDLARILKPVETLTELLDQEAALLEQAQLDDGFMSARRKYLAKLNAMSRSFETRARKRGALSGRDERDFDADMLIDRMPLDAA